MPDADDRPLPAAAPSVLRLWIALLLGLLAASLAVRAGDRLPRPLPEDAPADAFAAGRAWRTLAHLADTIGFRVSGTAGGRRAAAYVAERLREIPGLEVEVQEAEGGRRGRARLRRYRTTNVLARLPGRTPDAVLLSTHWDTPPGSAGASDAGVPAAVAIEVARALAAGPRLERTVILNINGAEEQGLLGAEGFLRHPWARDVRVFVDLESAGPGGKSALFQVGPGAAWLARAYARAAPHPHGTVLGQDIFQSGAIPSSTDFEIYRDAGLVGLDVAFYEDGWSYHTARDRTWNVDAGSVQHMGANALGLVRALASEGAPVDAASGSPSVYYDLFGAAMLAYDQELARAVALFVLLLALAAVGSATRGGRAVAALSAIAGATAAIPLALAATLAAAAIPPLLLGRPHGWFARPWLALAAHAPIAIAAMLLAHWLVSLATRRLASPRDRAIAAAAGAVAALALLYAALTLAGIGSAYVVLWLLAPASLALLAAAWLPSRTARVDAALAGAAILPGALLALQLLVLLLRLFAPIAGRFPLPFPFDLPIAGIVAAMTALLATLPLALVHAVGRFGAAAAAGALAGLAGLGALAAVPPYDAEHPQRIALVHRSDASEGDRFELAGSDWPGIGGAIAALDSAVANGPAGRPGGARVPAPPVPHAAPRLERLSSAPLAGGVRTATVRVPREEGVYLHRLLVPAERLAGWSLGARPPATEGRIALDLLDAPADGWTFTIELRGAEPVPVELQAIRAETTPAAARLIERLPAWTTVVAQSMVVGRMDL